MKTNSIIVLENGEEYILLNEAMYYGKKYFLAMGLTNKREVDSKKIIIFEEYINGFETYVTKVSDSNIIAVLTRMFKAQVEIA